MTPGALPRVERCELSDLPVASCGCRVHRPGPSLIDVELSHARVTKDFGRPVEAQYPGLCPTCEEWYRPGDPIRLNKLPQQTGKGRWHHAECATESMN